MFERHPAIAKALARGSIEKLDAVGHAGSGIGAMDLRVTPHGLMPQRFPTRAIPNRHLLSVQFCGRGHEYWVSAAWLLNPNRLSHGETILVVERVANAKHSREHGVFALAYLVPRHRCVSGA